MLLGQLDDQTVVYNLPRPTQDGRTCLLMNPMELLKRLAALIHQRHSLRSHGCKRRHRRKTAASFATPATLILPFLHHFFLRIESFLAGM